MKIDINRYKNEIAKEKDPQKRAKLEEELDKMTSREKEIKGRIIKKEKQVANQKENLTDNQKEKGKRLLRKYQMQLKSLKDADQKYTEIRNQ